MSLLLPADPSPLLPQSILSTRAYICQCGMHTVRVSSAHSSSIISVHLAVRGRHDHLEIERIELVVCDSATVMPFLHTEIAEWGLGRWRTVRCTDCVCKLGLDVCAIPDTACTSN